MKKINSIKVFTLLLFMVVLSACSKNSSIFDNSLKAKDLSISDFTWSTEYSKCSGENCYIVSFTNNSNYDVISPKFIYKVKDDISDESLNVYNKFMQEHSWFLNEGDTVRGVTLIGYDDSLVEKSKNTRKIIFTVGFDNTAWHDYPTKEQFELMEPKELSLGVIGKDSKLYLAYYNFIDKSWSIDETIMDVNVWPTSELAKKVDKIVGKYFMVTYNSENSISVQSYGASKDDYDKYVGKLKSNGFTNEESYSSYLFEAKDGDGAEVNLWYDEDTFSLAMTLNKD